MNLNSNINLRFFTDSSSFGCIAKQDGNCISCKLSISEAIVPESVINIDYVEKLHAVGKIPGGFNKRESRNKESEIFSSRLITEALRGSIDSLFRKHINVYINVENYNRNIPTEGLAITALSALMRYAGLPSTLIAAEAVSYNKETKEWKSPANDAAFLLVSGSSQGLTSFSYNGIELAANVLSRGAMEAYQKICQKIEYIYQILPNTLCKWISPVSEQHHFPYEPKYIAEAYVSNNSQEINRLKEKFIQTWIDKDLAEVKWLGAVKQILKAYLGWQNKRLCSRKLDQEEGFTLDQELIKHNSGCAVLKGQALVLCYCTVSNSNEYQMIDSYTSETARKLIVHTDFIGFGSHKAGVFESILVRNILKICVVDDRFIRVVVEFFMSGYPVVVPGVAGAWNAMKSSGIRLSAPVAAISVGIVLQNALPRFILDINEQEIEYLIDAVCYFGGSKHGFVSVTIFSSIFLPLSTVESVLLYAGPHLDNALENVANVAVSVNKDRKHFHKNQKPSHTQGERLKNYSIVFSQKNPKLKELKDNLVKFQGVLGCNIKLVDRTVTIEAGEHSLVNKLIKELYMPNSTSDVQISYAKVAKLDEKYIYCKLLDGKDVKVKRENLKTDITENADIVLQYKKSWTFLEAL